MFEWDGDSQKAFGLLSTSLSSQATRPAASEPTDPWARLHQVEVSIQRLERLPQSFARIAHFFYSGSIQDGHKLLRHCLETLSQLFLQWPLNMAADTPGALPFAATLARGTECLELIREVCHLREEGDIEAMAHCIEDELIMALKGLDVALRALDKRMHAEIA